MAQDDQARGRDRVLLQLKKRGPGAATDLARRLRITPMAVRQHLASLEEEGLVSWSEERRKVGRPTRIWELTDAAADRFPDAHADLTVDLLDSMREAFGDEGMEKLLAARRQRQLAHYRKILPAEDAPLEKRVAALAATRRQEGYMAEWSRDRKGGFLLLENHCPICAAATVCQGLCRDELSLFRSVLGPDVQVERCEHLLSGARRCTYRITPADSAAQERA